MQPTKGAKLQWEPKTINGSIVYNVTKTQALVWTFKCETIPVFSLALYIKHFKKCVWFSARWWEIRILLFFTWRNDSGGALSCSSGSTTSMLLLQLHTFNDKQPLSWVCLEEVCKIIGGSERVGLFVKQRRESGLVSLRLVEKCHSGI